MVLRARHLATILVVAVTATLLLAALPGSVVATSYGPKACKVMNVNQGFGRDSLQKAVWAAAPGDTLSLQGTCTGTTLIEKSVTIGGFPVGGSECGANGNCQSHGDSGWPTLKSGTWRPTIVVDPGVTDFKIVGVAIRHGLIVDEIANWKGKTRVKKATWRSHPRSARGSFYFDPGRGRRACSVIDMESGERFERMQLAVDAASAGDHLLFQGKCGSTVVDKSLHIQGLRTVLASSVECRSGRCSKPHETTTGVPVLGNVAVAAGVDDVAFKHVRIQDSFAVE